MRRRYVSLVGDSARFRARNRLRHRRPAVSLRSDARKTSVKPPSSLAAAHASSSSIRATRLHRRAAFGRSKVGRRWRARCTRLRRRACCSAARRPMRPPTGIAALAGETRRIVSIAGATSVGSFGALARARAPSSVSRPARCTSRPPSAVRPSASSHFNPIFPIAGRRWASGLRSYGRRFPVTLATRKSAVADYACIASLDRAGFFAALDIVARLMRATIQLCTYNRAALLERVLERCFDQTRPR